MRTRAVHRRKACHARIPTLIQKISDFRRDFSGMPAQRSAPHAQAILAIRPLRSPCRARFAEQSSPQTGTAPA